MDIKQLIQGLHHVTATVGNAQADYQFYTHLLGLRLVKKTVNFDNNQVYHFYYGNEQGQPGTIMTTFPYEGQGVRVGIPGSGQVDITAFSVPGGSLDFWQARLKEAGVDFQKNDPFGAPTLQFKDPSGLILELVESTEDPRVPWMTGEISQAVAIRGIHHVTLSIQDLGPSQDFILNEFGFRKLAEEGKVTRYAAAEAVPGNFLQIRHDADRAAGKNGMGTVHHVAWRVANDEALLAMRRRLVEDLGFKVTELKDRNYFHSIYFRIPGGVLFEIATIPPGFTVDESLEGLGQSLKLPEWEEVNRVQIESVLPSLDQ